MITKAAQKQLGPDYPVNVHFNPKYNPWDQRMCLIPDADLSLDPATGVWAYDEPDWNELRTVVTNHGPKSQERLDFRRANWDATQWVRDSILGGPRAEAVA